MEELTVVSFMPAVPYIDYHPDLWKDLIGRGVVLYAATGGYLAADLPGEGGLIMASTAGKLRRMIDCMEAGAVALNT